LGAVENLEFQIEQQRTKMYQASQEKDNTEKLISISQDLDRLLNKLEKLKNHYRLN